MREARKNLIPNSERSPEELREMGRKGGIASGKARRKKKKVLRDVKLWLEVFGELERKEPEELQKVLRKLEELNSK